MLDTEFTLPPRALAEAETFRRRKRVHHLRACLGSAAEAVIVAGSVASGAGYSVHEESDVDVLILVRRENARRLHRLSFWDAATLDRALHGYEMGYYDQFTLEHRSEGVRMECHFWDHDAYIQAITLQQPATRRLRGDHTTPAIDYAFSFGRQESSREYYGEIVSGYAVAEFPSFRRSGALFYPCRPITNLIGGGTVEASTPELRDAIDTCWRLVVGELALLQPVNLSVNNLTNTLPGLNKLAPRVRQEIHARSQTLLDELAANSSDDGETMSRV